VLPSILQMFVSSCSLWPDCLCSFSPLECELDACEGARAINVVLLVQYLH
jgi:hypothetical protein